MIIDGEYVNYYATLPYSAAGKHREIIALTSRLFYQEERRNWASVFRMLAEYFISIEWYVEAMTCYCLSERYGDDGDAELAELAVERLEDDLGGEIIPLSIIEVQELADYFGFPF